MIKILHTRANFDNYYITLVTLHHHLYVGLHHHLYVGLLPHIISTHRWVVGTHTNKTCSLDRPFQNAVLWYFCCTHHSLTNFILPHHSTITFTIVLTTIPTAVLNTYGPHPPSPLPTTFTLTLFLSLSFSLSLSLPSPSLSLSLSLARLLSLSALNLE